MDEFKQIIYQKGRAFPLVGVTVRHQNLTVEDAVIMITEESQNFSCGSMSKKTINDLKILKENCVEEDKEHWSNLIDYYTSLQQGEIEF